MNAPNDNEVYGDPTSNHSSWIVRSASGYVFCEPHGRCRHPKCPICEWIKSKKMVRTVDAVTVDTTNLLSITLTIPPSTQSLERQIRELLDAFNHLRDLAPWKFIVGGVRCVHVGYRPIDECWHPHIHILAEGWAVAADEIEYRWLKLTGGNAMVKVIDGEEHRRRMAWYVSKSPNEDLKEQPQRLAEFLKVRRRFRMKATFGNLYGNPLYSCRRKKSCVSGKLIP